MTDDVMTVLTNWEAQLAIAEYSLGDCVVTIRSDTFYVDYANNLHVRYLAPNGQARESSTEDLFRRDPLTCQMMRAAVTKFVEDQEKAVFSKVAILMERKRKGIEKRDEILTEFRTDVAGAMITHDEIITGKRRGSAVGPILPKIHELEPPKDP